MKDQCKKEHGECVECTGEEEESMFKAFDRSESGLLSFEDVCEGNKRKCFYMCRLMEIVMAWTAMFAKGFHMSDESMKKMGEWTGWSEDWAKKCSTDHDADANGYLNLCEFKKMKMDCCCFFKKEFGESDMPSKECLEKAFKLMDLCENG